MLSSIKTAYFFLISLAAAFGLAVRMSRSDTLYAIFSQMNHSDIFSWYRYLLEHFGFLSWFVLLVSSALGLFVSTLDCAVIKRKIRSNNLAVGGHLKPWNGIFMIHLVTLLVFVCHAGDLFVVKRYPPVKMLVSDEMECKGFSIKVKFIHYESDRNAIKGATSRKFMRLTSDEFDPKANWALLEIKDSGVGPETHRAGFMSPVSYKGNFFLVDSFYYDESSDAVGIRLLRVYNPMVVFFFFIYLLFLVALAVRWVKTRSPGNSSAGWL